MHDTYTILYKIHELKIIIQFAVQFLVQFTVRSRGSTKITEIK